MNGGCITLSGAHSWRSGRCRTVSNRSMSCSISVIVQYWTLEKRVGSQDQAGKKSAAQPTRSIHLNNHNFPLLHELRSPMSDPSARTGLVPSIDTVDSISSFATLHRRLYNCRSLNLQHHWYQFMLTAGRRCEVSNLRSNLLSNCERRT